MIYIDKYAYFNNLKDVHPVEKTLFSILTLGVILTVNSPVTSMLSFLTLSCLTVFAAKIPAGFYLKMLVLPFYFLLAGVLTIALGDVTHKTGIIFSFYIFNMNVGMTSAGLLMASRIFLKSMASVSALYFLILTVPVVDIINILRWLKIPELFIELMLLIYRFIFVFIDTMEKIMMSQKSRLGYSNIVSRFKSTAILISTLFILSFKKSMDIHNVLVSRCYSGKMCFLQKKYEFSLSFMCLLIIADSLFVASAFVTRGIV